MAHFAHSSSEKTTAAGARGRRVRRTVTGAVAALSLALGGLSLVSGLGDKLGGWMQPQGKSWASIHLINGKATPSEGTQGKSWAASVPAPPTTL